MATRKQVLFFLVLGYCLQAFGQVPRDAINCPTPDIAALGTFGSVPVSLYTGQPNLSIPLYEIKEGS
ncbi:MAG: hypothetical protein LBN93_04015, partial [Candidatus Symbiothrix sp.]|nr:hypothetical protein [Candidatus Symbiothrix sp.]